MVSKFSPWKSIHSRMTLAILCLFLASLWALSAYISQVLRQDLQKLLSEQQRVNVAMNASHLNEEINLRIRALQKVATLSIHPFLQGTSEVQEKLQQHPVLMDLFNGGVSACTFNDNGPNNKLAPAQFCNDYINSGVVTTALKKAQSTIGPLVRYDKTLETSIGMAVPLVDEQGKVVGALAGRVNLAQPNFLDKFTDNPYGATGGYFIISTQNRRIISATDTNRLFEILPPDGVNPALDQYVRGYEGSLITHDTQNTEVLASGQHIAAAHWLIAAALPTKEAFAPILRIERLVQIASIVMGLLAGMLSWWIIRRQLTPLLITVKTLDEITSGKQARKSLPVTRNDEVGHLNKAFNQLLTSLEYQELALRKSEILGRAILDSVEAEIAVLDHNGIIIAVNQPWQDLTDKKSMNKSMNKSTEESTIPGLAETKTDTKTDVGSTYQKVYKASGMNGNSALKMDEGIKAVLNGSLSLFRLEYSLDCPDTSDSFDIFDVSIHRSEWCSVVVTPLHHEVKGAVVSHTNITARKNIEETLELTRMSVAVASDAMFWITTDARIMDVNAAACTLLGFKREELISLSLNDIDMIYAQSKVEWRSLFAGLQETRSIKFESEYLTKDKKVLPVEIVANLVGHEKKAFICAFVRDITRRRSVELALRNAKIQAEKSNRSKSRFLATASHDLHQPIAALSLYVELLKKNVVVPDSEKLIRGIDQCVVSLSILLTDLLDISKLDAGVIIPKATDFFLDDLIMRLTSVYSAESVTKRLQLRVRHTGVMVHTDRLLLHRILANFISNAIHYTDEGAVLIGLRRRDGKYWLEVWDSGIGFPEDKARIIFEEFHQLTEGTEIRGSGLGLSIAGKMASLLGLQIRVRSRPGRGSMFAIEIPLSAATGQPLISGKSALRALSYHVPLAADGDKPSPEQAAGPLNGLSVVITCPPEMASVVTPWQPMIVKPLQIALTHTGQA